MRELPPGWVERRSATGFPYFEDTVNGVVQWAHPYEDSSLRWEVRYLPDGSAEYRHPTTGATKVGDGSEWIAFEDETGAQAYYNDLTMETTYEAPLEVVRVDHALASPRARA